MEECSAPASDLSLGPAARSRPSISVASSSDRLCNQGRMKIWLQRHRPDGMIRAATSHDEM